jgi:hypothetical protein
MNKDDVKNHLRNAAQNNLLLTPKHDPANLTTTYSTYSTVLSHDLAQNLDNFIESGEYIVREYHNNLYPNSPYYLEIEPYPGSTFSVPASGVAPYSPLASTALDRIVAVSGTNQGWHIFGEDSNEIALKLNNDNLTFIDEKP